MAGVLVGDLVSAWLALFPFAILWLVVLQLKADMLGPHQHVLDSDEPTGTSVLVGLILLALTLIPALVANATMGSWTGWSRRRRTLAAVIIVLAPTVASLASNDIWNALIHPW